MKRIRVAHIINSMEVGGAQRQIVNLFHAIDSSRFELRLICLAQKGILGESLEREGFTVAALGKGPGADLGMLFRLARLLRSWHPDVVHCSVFTANLWGRLAGKLAGVPVLISHEQSSVSLERWHRRAVDRFLARWTWKVLAVSEDLRGRILAEEGIAPQKVEVLYNAVDSWEIERSVDEAPRSLPGKTGKRIGIVGRIEYRKDHLTLVRAAVQVVREVADAVFLLVGNGPDCKIVENEVRRLGLGENFYFLGERQDVGFLLHHFDLYVLSSLTEGLSLSILEAMAAGCPVVATRVGGNSELLAEGRAGVLVSPRDAPGMARAIVGLLQNPRERSVLAQAAQNRARQVFDIRPVTRRLESLYLDGLKRKSGKAHAKG